MKERTYTLKELNRMLTESKNEYEQLKYRMKEALDNEDINEMKSHFTALENIKRSIDHMENYEFHIDWSQR